MEVSGSSDYKIIIFIQSYMRNLAHFVQQMSSLRQNINFVCVLHYTMKNGVLADIRMAS